MERRVGIGAGASTCAAAGVEAGEGALGEPQHVSLGDEQPPGRLWDVHSLVKLAGEVPGVHGQAAEGQDVGQRRQPMDHPELAVHRCQSRAPLRCLCILGVPDLCADAEVLLHLVPLHHHLRDKSNSIGTWWK